MQQSYTHWWFPFFSWKITDKQTIDSYILAVSFTGSHGNSVTCDFLSGWVPPAADSSAVESQWSDTHTGNHTHKHSHNHVLHCVPIFTCSALCVCRDIWCVGLWRLLALTSPLHSICSKTHHFLCLLLCLFPSLVLSCLFSTFLSLSLGSLSVLCSLSSPVSPPFPFSSPPPLALPSSPPDRCLLSRKTLSLGSCLYCKFAALIKLNQKNTCGRWWGFSSSLCYHCIFLAQLSV